MDCLFCKIINGDIPSAKVYEDEYVYAFKDINPQAPVHVLVVPKTHICCADKITAENSINVAKVFEAIPLDRAASLDELVRITAYSSPEIISTVTMLEIKGLITSLPGGLYIRR